MYNCRFIVKTQVCVVYLYSFVCVLMPYFSPQVFHFPVPKQKFKVTQLTILQDLNAQDQDEDPMNKLKGQKIVSCRICKGDHWTTRCPYKDTLGPMQKELAEQLGLSTGEKEKAAGVITETYTQQV